MPRKHQITNTRKTEETRIMRAEELRLLDQKGWEALVADSVRASFYCRDMVWPLDLKDITPAEPFDLWKTCFFLSYFDGDPESGLVVVIRQKLESPAAFLQEEIVPWA